LKPGREKGVGFPSNGKNPRQHYANQKQEGLGGKSFQEAKPAEQANSVRPTMYAMGGGEREKVTHQNESTTIGGGDGPVHLWKRGKKAPAAIKLISRGKRRMGVKFLIHDKRIGSARGIYLMEREMHQKEALASAMLSLKRGKGRIRYCFSYAEGRGGRDRSVVPKFKKERNGPSGLKLITQKKKKSTDQYRGPVWTVEPSGEKGVAKVARGQ